MSGRTLRGKRKAEIEKKGDKPKAKVPSRKEGTIASKQTD